MDFLCFLDETYVSLWTINYNKLTHRFIKITEISYDSIRQNKTNTKKQ